MKIAIFISFIIMTPVFLLANNWEHSTQNDAMTGKKSSYAFSPSVLSKEKMDFPYSGTKSWIGIGCKDEKQWVYFGFSVAPNLNDTKIQDGYSTLVARIKFGNELDDVRLTQEWGAKSLHLSDSENKDAFIEKLKKVDSVLLELSWHGNGKTYFKYPLRGSSNAITNIRDNCGFTKAIQEREKQEEQRKIEIKKQQEEIEKQEEQRKIEVKNQQKTWEDKKEILCRFEINTTRTDIENILDIKIPDNLTNCKVYSSTSTVCTYKGKNVLGNNKIELIRKYRNNPKVCSEFNTKECVTYIFENDKLDRIAGCANEELNADKIEEIKIKCIKQTGSWRFGDKNQIICGDDS